MRYAPVCLCKGLHTYPWVIVRLGVPEAGRMPVCAGTGVVCRGWGTQCEARVYYTSRM